MDRSLHVNWSSYKSQVWHTLSVWSSSSRWRFFLTVGAKSSTKTASGSHTHSRYGGQKPNPLLGSKLNQSHDTTPYGTAVNNSLWGQLVIRPDSYGRVLKTCSKVGKWWFHGIILHSSASKLHPDDGLPLISTRHTHWSGLVVYPPVLSCFQPIILHPTQGCFYCFYLVVKRLWALGVALYTHDVFLLLLCMNISLTVSPL